jgi:hypothetical protein
MIIESGIDVLQVLCGSVSSENPEGLWIVAMDENLRLLYVDQVVRQLTSGVERHIDDLARYLECARDICYFALAWTSPVEIDAESSWLADTERRLHDDPGLGVSRLLGIIVFDRSALYASLPRCDFSIERGFADLPRAMALAGPHGLDCSCPPCAADRRAFEEGMDDKYGADSCGADLYGADSYNPDYERPIALVAPRFDPFAKRWYPPPPRAGKRWTRDEERAIALSHEQGLSCFDISILVRRQPGAVARRLNRLGLSSATRSL